MSGCASASSWDRVLGTHRREIEAALRRDVGVRVEREVGDRRRLADQPLATGDRAVENPQRPNPSLALSRQEPLALGIGRQVGYSVAHGRDVRLAAVLLPAEPAQHLRLPHPIRRKPRRPHSEVPEDGVALWEAGPVRQLEYRDALLGVEPGGPITVEGASQETRAEWR